MGAVLFLCLFSSFSFSTSLPFFLPSFLPHHPISSLQIPSLISSSFYIYLDSLLSLLRFILFCSPSAFFVSNQDVQSSNLVEKEEDISFGLMGPSSGQGNSKYDYSFKVLLIGDSGVGKSCLLLSFINSSFENLPPTIGVDFKIKLLTVGGKNVKLTIWDTAGQEKFKTLTSSYYRGAQGIILVYDVTRRETFANLSDVWAKEVKLRCTNQDCIKMLVGNKVDRDNDRAVTREEGAALAKDLGCLFLECSAKTRENVEQCFEELVLKILNVPSLVEEGSTATKGNIMKPGQGDMAPPLQDSLGCC